MKNITFKNRIAAAVLAAVLAVFFLAACGRTQTTIVQRKVDSNRGTTFNQKF